MTKNKNLHRAKSAKNDEFYTQLSDIEKELQHYKDHFKDKIVFLNCDDPEESNFWRYFELNFEFLGLKKLISTQLFITFSFVMFWLSNFQLILILTKIYPFRHIYMIESNMNYTFTDP